MNNMLKSVKSTWRMGWILSVYGRWETVRNRRIKNELTGINPMGIVKALKIKNLICWL